MSDRQSAVCESQETTADWAGGPPRTRRYTRKHPRSGRQWGTRVVRPDGSVKWKGRLYEPRGNVQVRPVPGELLLFYDYDDAWEEQHGRLTIMEWTAPPDPDSYIRREVWVAVDAPAEVKEQWARGSILTAQDGEMWLARQGIA